MLLDAIAQAYAEQTDKTVLIIGDRHWSCQSLISAVDDQADVFRQAGLQEGDRLLSLLPTGWHAVITLLACAKLHLVYAPLPLSMTASAFARALSSVSGAGVVIWHGVLSDHAETLNASAEVKAIFNAHGADPLIQCQLPWSTPRPRLAVQSEGSKSAAYILTMTSGSTGDPKPIALSQATKLLRARAAISTYNVGPEDVTLVATPLYHSLAQRLLFVSLLSGGCAVIMAKYQLNLWVDTIAMHNVSFTIAVSSQLSQLIDQDPTVFTRLSPLKTLVSSSALMTTEDKHRLLSRLECRFHECYGASEVAIASDVRFGSDAPMGTVGKPLPGVIIQIHDDRNKPMMANEVGEICVRSPYRFSGYYGLQAVTEQSFSGGFFKTGDLGYLDDEGYLFYVGRKKEVIISGGINVYPNDIEQVVSVIGGVAEVAAFPVPDKRLGEVVGVAVVAEPATILNEEFLALQVLDRLADYQMPRHWYFVAELPKTTLGKLQRYQLSRLLSTDTVVLSQQREG